MALQIPLHPMAFKPFTGHGYGKETNAFFKQGFL
jgi:hypothetical protein